MASVLVDHQEKALRFYTKVLGFVKKHDVPVGADRWLTVVSPQELGGTELLLELAAIRRSSRAKMGALLRSPPTWGR